MTIPSVTLINSHSNEIERQDRQMVAIWILGADDLDCGHHTHCLHQPHSGETRHCMGNNRRSRLSAQYRYICDSDHRRMARGEELRSIEGKAMLKDRYDH